MRFVRTRLLQLVVDGLVIGAALAAAYAIRFEGVPPRHYLKQFLLVLPYLMLLRVGMLAAFGVYRLVWRYIGLRDLPRIVGATLAGTALLVGARYAVAPALAAFGVVLNPLYATVPLGVLATELVIDTMSIVAMRAMWRFVKEETRRSPSQGLPLISGKRRALLIGAGSAGVMIAKEVATNSAVGFEVVGFVDDDRDKHGTIIQGFHVLGGTDALAELAEQHHADLVVITMANAPAKAVRRIVNLAEACQLKVQIIPGLYEILSGRVNISKIRDVRIEDLLGREPVSLDEVRIGEFLTAKTVMVTGAGGSIGSEICRQVARYAPRRLVLLDQAENPVFHIHKELALLAPDVPLEQVIANVANRERIHTVMQTYRPDVVFHAAAHKHVPLMELNPTEAIRNNVLGSKNMADLALQHRVDAFVMISTDKAVNPTSVMGASKRLAEMYVQALSKDAQQTRFLTVRFGNVLGSEGSVVPLFKEQIARGGPVTVTHPDMQRYFMTIPEASQLVLQAATMGAGGEILILEMGEPIRIETLARDLIRLSGYRPDEDIAIRFTGMRPGEKLYEEINLSEENAAKTKHPRIWIGQSAVQDSREMARMAEQMTRLLDHPDPIFIRQQLARWVPEYQPALGRAPASASAAAGGMRLTGGPGASPAALNKATAAGTASA